MQQNPIIANAVQGHTDASANAFKLVNGQLQQVTADQITPQDIASGNAFFLLSGATGEAKDVAGPRARMSQLYRAEGNDLVPVGDAKRYTGTKITGLEPVDMVASMLAMVPGPWQVPA